MAKYRPTGRAPNEDVDTLATWLNEEVNKIAGVLNNLEVPYLLYEQLHIEPTKPTEGMIVYADGTDWNPNSGIGLYQYRAGSWVDIG